MTGYIPLSNIDLALAAILGSTAIALRRTSGSGRATQVPAGQSKGSPSTVNSARPPSTT